jgi:hypothetical protein
MLPSLQKPQTGPLLFGRYRVLEQLGEGRLAGVYRAADERLQRAVLVHLLRKDLVGQQPLRQRFLDEAGSSARRSHPALLEVFDSGEVAGRPFMVTEFAQGRVLGELGALALEDALLYTRQVAGAVAVCQGLGLPHPPISSRNLLLVDEGRVKLLESWLTPLLEVALDLAHYRPPERTEGQPPTPASAVYALGLLLYELVAGRRPLSGNDPRTVAQAHLQLRIPPLSAARPGLYLPSLERLLARATARAPEQRPPDAAAFAEALDALRREVGADTQRLVVAPAPVRRRARGQSASAAQATMGVDQWLAQAASQPAPAPDPYTQNPAPYAVPPVQRGLSRDEVRRQSLRRATLGWVVALLLLLGVAYGSYVGAGYLVDQFFAIKLPQPQLPGLDLPPWLGGARETYVVNIAEGLNLRDGPGIGTTIVDVIPNGTRVQQIEGPAEADGVTWLRVRGEIDGRTFEGWMSLKYLTRE